MRQLMYTPHPSYSEITSSFPEHLVVEKNHIFEIYPRDFKRLIEVCSDLTQEIEAILPDFIPIFAAGAVPLNMGIIHRLMRNRNNYFMTGNVFHLFPGLNWKYKDIKGKEYFDDYYDALLKNNNGANTALKVFVVDTTFTGNAINNILNILKEYHDNNETCRTEIYVRGILDLSKEKKDSEQIGEYDSIPVNVILNKLIPASVKCDLLNGGKWQFSKNVIMNLKYIPVVELFTEDESKLLGTTILRQQEDGQLEGIATIEARGDIMLKTRYGVSVGYSTGRNSLAQRLSSALSGYRVEEDLRLFANVEAMNKNEAINRSLVDRAMFISFRLGDGDQVATEKALIEKRGMLEEYEIYWISMNSRNNDLFFKCLDSLALMDNIVYKDVLEEFLNWYNDLLTEKSNIIDKINDTDKGHIAELLNRFKEN